MNTSTLRNLDGQTFYGLEEGQSAYKLWLKETGTREQDVYDFGTYYDADGELTAIINLYGNEIRVYFI